MSAFRLCRGNPEGFGRWPKSLLEFRSQHLSMMTLTLSDLLKGDFFVIKLKGVLAACVSTPTRSSAVKAFAPHRLNGSGEDTSSTVPPSPAAVNPLVKITVLPILIHNKSS